MFNGKIILLLLHKNFDFSENAVRNFNFILGYTIFTLILIVSKLLKRSLDEIFDFTQFHYYSIIFIQFYSYNYNSTHFILNYNFNYFKTSFRVNKFRPTISTKEMFHKRLFFGRSPRSLLSFAPFISSLLRLLYCHLCIEIQKLF